MFINKIYVGLYVDVFMYCTVKVAVFFKQALQSKPCNQPNLATSITHHKLLICGLKNKVKYSF